MTCPTCNKEVDKNDRFCGKCGRPLLGPRAAKVSAILTDDFDIEELGRMQQEKKRLTQELKQILDGAHETGEVSLAEQERYQKLRDEWGGLTAEITRRLEYLEARKTYERRNVNRRHGDRRNVSAAIDFPERRAGSDRRSDQRRTGSDRRTPFD